MHRPSYFWLLAAAVLFAGCWPGPRVGESLDSGANPNTSPVTFAEIQTQVLARSCLGASCHEGNPPRDAPMSLESSVAYYEMVDVPAAQVAARRVVPGDVANSYLVKKLRGAAQGAGGIATRMPLNAPPLDSATLAAIEAWIERGAPND